jgi:rfaE bifunctional protein nucleotidyltransferase chain/domain
MSRSLEPRKVFTRAEVAQRIRELKAEKPVVVGFTSGVFDLLHPGHVAYLEAARSRVDLLVVAVNSDQSVKSYKGPGRPICGEDARARVVAALASVDFVFIFDERTNAENIEQLRPDLYLKAGDYSREKLTSASLVESYGGKVETIAFEDGFSSSGIIEKIRSTSLEPLLYEKAREIQPGRPAVFVDRDGTIIREFDYLNEPEKVEELPGAYQALRKLQDAGFVVVMVTNQPGIGLGYLTREEFIKVTGALLRQASGRHGVLFERVCFCPHSKGARCACRKPGTALVQGIVDELKLDLSKSWVIGDMTCDAQLAQNVGCRSVGVKTGKGLSDGEFKAQPTLLLSDLAEAADAILRIVSEEAGHPGRRVMRHNQQSSAAASDALAALSQLSRNVAHDFNNLLGAIQGCIDLIRQKLGVRGRDEEHPLGSALRIMEKATESGRELTAKLGSFGEPDHIQSPAALRRCLECVEGLLRIRHTVEVHIDCAEDIKVEAPEFQLTQMILQIAKNAVDAMANPRDRHLLFHASLERFDRGRLSLPDGEYVRLSIIDHGAGLKAELQETVFTPFLSTKLRGVGKGLGLSMAMARSIMTHLGGALTLASRVDTGTTISLLFPAPGTTFRCENQDTARSAE